MNLQVRSRAVTSEKYICSSEDILKYASKLLKAELPISLRLMGKNSHYGLYSLSSEGENELFCVLIHVSLREFSYILGNVFGWRRNLL